MARTTKAGIAGRGGAVVVYWVFNLKKERGGVTVMTVSKVMK